MLKKYFLSVVASLLLMTQVSAQTILIKPGDTLSALSKQYNTSVTELARVNGIVNPDLIFAGRSLEIGQSIGANPLPSDNYDSYLTSALSASASTVFVNALPTGVTESIYTIFASDGITPSEKIYCTGTSSGPNKLTTCTRGVSFSPSSGIIRETAGTGTTHSKNSRIAITDNINFSGKAIAILNGSQETGSNVLLIGTTSTAGLKFNAGDYQTIAYGQTGSPFFRFNSSTGHWQFSDDGTNTTNLATSSAAGLSASTTAGIGITNSLIFVNASTTQGMAFGADGRLYVKTSSTLALAADSNGLYINTSTLVSLIATTTPVSSTIPRVDVSGNLFGFKTDGDYFTASGTINKFDVVYVSTTGQVFKYNSSTAVFDSAMVGIALNTTTAGNLVPVQFSGIVSGMSGLTIGSVYYTDKTTSGTISTTYTDQALKVGIALTTSKLSIQKSLNRLANVGIISVGGSGNSTATGGSVSLYLSAGEKVLITAQGSGTQTVDCGSTFASVQDNGVSIGNSCGWGDSGIGSCAQSIVTTTQSSGLHTYQMSVTESGFAAGSCTWSWGGVFSVLRLP